MEQLKKITESNLLDIAEIINPHVTWEAYTPTNKWDGLDAIAEGFILQIDFGGNENTLSQDSAFRYYYSTPISITPMPISTEKLFEIFKYLVRSNILQM